jgi:hypothetical protein
MSAMAYSLWHSGVLIGEADFERNPSIPRHMVGVFQPTAYGTRLLPRLTGLLAAAAELKDEMRSRGMSEEAMVSAASPELLESTKGGQGILEVSRALSEVELRDPAGAVLKFKSIAFVDLAELKAVARRVGLQATAANLESLPPIAPQVLVSVTLVPRHRFRLQRSRIALS